MRLCEALYAPRRALLDRTLVDAAAQSGAEVRHGVRIDDVIVDERGRVSGVTAIADGTQLRIEADIVVGADGLQSTIAKRVGAAHVVEGRHSTGVLYTYWQDCPVDGYYWRFQTGDAGYFKDPLTAHGITDSLRDAELLARAILKGTVAAFAEYENTRLDLSRRLFEITDEIASFAWTDADLQSLHREFSREMSREVRALAGLGPFTDRLTSASTPQIA